MNHNLKEMQELELGDVIRCMVIDHGGIPQGWEKPIETVYQGWNKIIDQPMIGFQETSDRWVQVIAWEKIG